MVARKTARIDFDAGLNVFRKSKMAVDDSSQASDFVRRKERWRTAAPMELRNFAAGIEQRAHLGHLFFEIIDIGLALAVVQGDDGGAAAIPTKRLAKGDVVIEGEIALGA